MSPLSAVGEIVSAEWKRAEDIRPNVTLDQWVVMPNHIHGIVVIDERTPVSHGASVETTRRVVSTANTLTANSLGSIIGQFKSVSTKRIRATGYTDFAWQSRFYDHIIRNQKSLRKIQEYIVNNVAQWEQDRNHPSGLHAWFRAG